MQMGETYWVDRDRDKAGKWFAKAAELATRYEECDNADVLNAVARAHLRYSSWLLGEQKIKLAKKYLNRAMDVLCFELKIRNDPVLSNLAFRARRMKQKIRENLERPEDEAVEVIDKNLHRIYHATKMLGLVFSFLAYCYDVQGKLAKTLECNKMSLIVINSLDRRKSNVIDKNLDRRGTTEANFRRLLYANEEKYKLLVDEEREIERVLEVNYWRFDVFPQVNMTLPELRVQDYLNEDLRKFRSKLRHSNALESRPLWSRSGEPNLIDNRLSIDSSYISKSKVKDQPEKKVVFAIEVQEFAKKKSQLKVVRSENLQKRHMRDNSDSNPINDVNSSGSNWRIKGRKKLPWIEDSNLKLKYEQPISNYFDKTVTSTFDKYLKVKETLKAEIDVSNLEKDKFWQLRRKRVMKYSEAMGPPPLSSSDIQPTQADESLLEQRGDINTLKKTLEMDNYFSKTIGQMNFKQTNKKINFEK